MCFLMIGMVVYCHNNPAGHLALPISFLELQLMLCLQPSFKIKHDSKIVNHKTNLIKACLFPAKA